MHDDMQRVAGNFLSPGLESKYLSFDQLSLQDDGRIEGYASLFNVPDQGGDVVLPGAFSSTLMKRASPVRFLWQHDICQPIGIWDELTEKSEGLFVRGRLALSTQRGAEALTLLRMGALDGVSIGYRTLRSEKDSKTGCRNLVELELWEISLVTFPMLVSARVSPITSEAPAYSSLFAGELAELSAVLAEVRAALS